MMLGVVNLDYVGGSNIHKGAKLMISKNFAVGNGAVAMCTAKGEKKATRRNVLHVQWQESSTRSVGKAAVGAIVGGVLTGGIGVIAGAAIGGRKRDQSIAVVTVDVDGESHELYVRCNQKHFKEITSW